MKLEDHAARTARFDSIRVRNEKDFFEKFLDQPMTKLVLSMMPMAEPPELTRTVLLAAFKAGMQAGEATCTEDLVAVVENLKNSLDKGK